MNADGHEYQGQTEAIPGTEGSGFSGSANQAGEGRPTGIGRATGNASIGNRGAAGPWGIASNPVTGGIIAQLIAQVEDQLGEAVECVEWYQRSVEKYQRQLDNLKQLQKLAEQEAEGQE